MDSKRKKVIKSSVKESVKKLVEQAQKAFREGKEERSRRYIEMALDLIKKHKAKLPPELRNSFCRKCHLVWIPKKTVTVSFDSKTHCLRVKCKCGHTKRI
jgi:RNase P subunit RPR2